MNNKYYYDECTPKLSHDAGNSLPPVSTSKNFYIWRINWCPGNHIILAMQIYIVGLVQEKMTSLA